MASQPGLTHEEPLDRKMGERVRMGMRRGVLGEVGRETHMDTQREETAEEHRASGHTKDVVCSPAHWRPVES